MPWWSILLMILLVIYIIGMVILFFIKRKKGTLGACGDCPSNGACHGQCEHEKQTELLNYYKSVKKNNSNENHSLN